MLIECIVLTYLGVAQGVYDKALDLSPYIKTNPQFARKLSQVNDPSGIIPPSHSGFINVNQRFGSRVFFWFFHALNGNPKAPLVLYMTYVPGSSSVSRAVYETGPVRLTTQNGNVGYERRNDSWAESFSMLYIDIPVGQGFSYTENDQGYSVDQDGYANDFYSFIEQFYQIFPEYYCREFYIGGSSYAGKYAPAFAFVLDQKIRLNETKIKLSGIYIGAPYYYPFAETFAAPDTWFSLGLFSVSQRAEFIKNNTELQRKLSDPSNNVTADEIVATILTDLGLADTANYDTQQGIPQNLSLLYTATRVRKLLHVGNQNFKQFNPVVLAKLSKDIMASAADKLGYLMNHYKVLLYNGDYDMNVSTNMVEAALALTQFNQRYLYFASKRKTWRVDTALAGYYTKAGSFCRVIIRKCGHLAPFDQPEISLLMMQEFIVEGCVI